MPKNLRQFRQLLDTSARRLSEIAADASRPKTVTRRAKPHVLKHLLGRRQEQQELAALLQEKGQVVATTFRLPTGFTTGVDIMIFQEWQLASQSAEEARWETSYRWRASGFSPDDTGHVRETWFYPGASNFRTPEDASANALAWVLSEEATGTEADHPAN